MAAVKLLRSAAKIVVFLSLTVLLLAACIWGLLSGSVNVTFSQLLSLMFSGQADEITRQVILEVRLPRILLAVSVGGGLSIAGAVYQAILMNPLAEPYILGISSGAAFGAVLSMLLGAGFLFMQLFSFTGALAVVLLVFLLGRRFGELEPNTMLLSGVMVGSFFSATILMMVTFLNESLRTAVYWMMGSLSFADTKSVYYIFPLCLLISLILSLNSHKYNVLALGTETARHLGINTELFRNMTYVLSSVLVGALVSVSGIVGFVGLLIPHVCRMLFGLDNRVIVPASFLLGAAYLTAADTLARTLIAPSEIPVGAVTALLGSPIFIYLLRKRFNLSN